MARIIIDYEIYGNISPPRPKWGTEWKKNENLTLIVDKNFHNNCCMKNHDNDDIMARRWRRCFLCETKLYHKFIPFHIYIMWYDALNTRSIVISILFIVHILFFLRIATSVERKNRTDFFVRSPSCSFKDWWCFCFTTHLSANLCLREMFCT
jgi:hypothetical protein